MKGQNQRTEELLESLTVYMKLLSREELEIIFMLVRELARKSS